MSKAEIVIKMMSKAEIRRRDLHRETEYVCFLFTAKSIPSNDSI
jgi:hypothetical protein